MLHHMENNDSFWGSTDFAYTCLIDNKRTSAFREAIMQTVKKGDIVVDAGSGTGILGLFALEAGASHVTFIEYDSILCHSIEQSLRESIYDQDQYTILNEDVLTVDLHQKIDVIICEMIATALIDEMQIPALRHLRKFAHESTKYIPVGIENFADLVFDNDEFYGHKLHIIRYEYCGYAKDQSWQPESFTEPEKYLSVDFSKPNISDEVNTSIQFKIIKNGSINGLRIRNNSILSPNIYLDNSLAYCMPIILPLQTRNVKAGEEYECTMHYKICGGLQNLRYAIVRH